MQWNGCGLLLNMPLITALYLCGVSLPPGLTPTDSPLRSQAARKSQWGSQCVPPFRSSVCWLVTPSTNRQQTHTQDSSSSPTPSSSLIVKAGTLGGIPCPPEACSLSSRKFCTLMTLKNESKEDLIVTLRDGDIFTGWGMNGWAP